jgi:hypothetical protein
MTEVNRQQLQTRLAALQDELELGERRLQELDVERNRVRDTVLRISGALQVLQELLGDLPVAPASADAVDHVESPAKT